MGFFSDYIAPALPVAGAVVGSVVPGVGTAAGAAIGTAVAGAGSAIEKRNASQGIQAGAALATQGGVISPTTAAYLQQGSQLIPAQRVSQVPQGAIPVPPSEEMLLANELMLAAARGQLPQKLNQMTATMSAPERAFTQPAAVEVPLPHVLVLTPSGRTMTGAFTPSPSGLQGFLLDRQTGALQSGKWSET